MPLRKEELVGFSKREHVLRLEEGPPDLGRVCHTKVHCDGHTHCLLDTTVPSTPAVSLKHLAESVPAVSSCLFICDLRSLHPGFSLYSRGYCCFFSREGLGVFPLPRSQLSGLGGNLLLPVPLGVGPLGSW